MMNRPSIAVVTPDALRGLGLKTLLERLIPVARIDLYADAGLIPTDRAACYFHFFVSPGQLRDHADFFAPCRERVILLSEGAPDDPEVPSLDISRDAQAIERDILRMHARVHGESHVTPPRKGPDLLSAREAEVLRLVAEGLLGKEIADRMGIAPTTVISHRRNLTRKLGIRTISGLTRYAVAMGYVSPRPYDPPHK